MQGGAELNPVYQITSPVFDRVTIHLDQNYFPGKQFTIIARNNSAANMYIQSAKLKGKTLDQYWIPHSALVNGGELELLLGPKPSRWGTKSDPTRGVEYLR